jgi:hypothetical protein
MKRKPIQIILAITISLAIPVSSTYICYYTVASADFLSHNLKLESFDQEYLAASNQNELKVSGSGGLFNGSQFAAYPIGLLAHLFSKTLSFNQKTLILRC